MPGSNLDCPLYRPRHLLLCYFPTLEQILFLGLCASTWYISIPVFSNRYITFTTCNTSFGYFTVNTIIETFQNVKKIFPYACWKLCLIHNNIQKRIEAFKKVQVFTVTKFINTNCLFQFPDTKITTEKGQIKNVW